MSAGLRYFIEVAKQKSIRGASERLHVAASAISRQVRLFEAEFGAPLLQRTLRGVELTAAGDAFLVYAKAIEAERTRVRQSIDDLKGLQRGHIRIASIDGVVAGPLSDIIATFRARYEGITFDVRSMGSEAVLEDVRRGDADIGIGFHTTAIDGVRVVHRVVDPLCVIVPTTHPLARLKTIPLAEALRFPVALPDPSFGVRRLIDSACMVRRIRPNIVLETNSIEALRGFARSGAGVTLLPYFTAKREVELRTVRHLIVNEPGLRDATIEIFVHADRAPPLAASAFLTAICSAIGTTSLPGVKATAKQAKSRA